MDLLTNEAEEIIAHQEIIMQLRNRIEEILKKGILKNFEISLYGSEGNDKPDTDFKPSQLGFF